MSDPKGAKRRYKTTNWAAYNAALKGNPPVQERATMESDAGGNAYEQ